MLVVESIKGRIGYRFQLGNLSSITSIAVAARL